MAKLKILVLEDDKNRIASFKKAFEHRFDVTYVDQAAKCVDVMFDAANLGEAFDVIFLDHDLGGQVYVNEEESNTGSEVVRWMIEDDRPALEQPQIVIHSMNTPAAINMENNLKRAGFEFVNRIQYSVLHNRYLHDPSFLS